MVITVSILLFVATLILSVRRKVVTLGIPRYKQMKEHKGREWKHEEAIIPLKIGEGVNAQVESEVKWCPETDEIYRKKEDVGIFEKEWKEITRHSDLYKRLLQNFKNKYIRNRGNRGGLNKTEWTILS